MSIHTFFKSFNELEKIVRCPGKFKYEEHNVAAHSWKVSQYAMFLATFEEEHGAVIDWKRLFQATSNHDYSEIFTGDIKTPTKYFTPELREMISVVEEAMIKTFIQEQIPAEYQEVFEEWMREGKDGTTEGKILAVADKLDQVYEAFGELQKGNPDKEFVNMYTSALKSLKDINMKCVDYLFDVVIPDMISETLLTAVDIKKLTQEIIAK